MNESYLLKVQNMSPFRNSIQGHIAKWILKKGPFVRNVVDFGAGKCEFSNSIKGINVIAIDSDPNFVNYANSDVHCLVGSTEALDSIQHKSIDLFYISNVLEHMELKDSKELLSKVAKLLKNDHGKLVVIQPNFRYSYKSYFDDVTHTTVFTDRSLKTLLQMQGFVVTKIHKRFLPYSLESRLRFLGFLAPIYLRFPFKFLKGQMYLESEVLDS